MKRKLEKNLERKNSHQNNILDELYPDAVLTNEKKQLKRLDQTFNHTVSHQVEIWTMPKHYEHRESSVEIDKKILPITQFPIYILIINSIKKYVL